MSVALYVIVSTGLVLVLSARLREARSELSRARREHDAAARAMRDEYGAYVHGVALSLACVLAGLGAMSWSSAQYRGARPAGPGREGAPADGAGVRVDG